MIAKKSAGDQKICVRKSLEQRGKGKATVGAETKFQPKGEIPVVSNLVSTSTLDDEQRNIHGLSTT
jgi:hypothetical protein